MSCMKQQVEISSSRAAWPNPGRLFSRFECAGDSCAEWIDEDAEDAEGSG